MHRDNHTSEASRIWSHPETIEHFAQKAPDARMIARLQSARPDTRVLDLGCAAGRNSVWLAERGLDVWALDASLAMVGYARKRLQPYFATPEQRVINGRMDNLSAFSCCYFDFVLAFGVLHFAQSMAEWERTLKEIARVTKVGGELLVSHHSPRSNLDGQPLAATAEAHVYRRASGRCQILLEPHELDARVGQWGFVPVVPTDEVTSPTERGWRVTVRGHYRLEVQGCVE
jgi:SAM-dependent methyltransferase